MMVSPGKTLKFAAELAEAAMVVLIAKSRFDRRHLRLKECLNYDRRAGDRLMWRSVLL